MLDGAGDQVLPPSRFQRLGGAADRNVVGFGAPARKQHFRRVGADQRGHVGASVVNRALGLLAEMVNARRIPEIVAQDRCHPVDNWRKQRGRRIVVQIDALHGIQES